MNVQVDHTYKQRPPPDFWLQLGRPLRGSPHLVVMKSAHVANTKGNQLPSGVISNKLLQKRVFFLVCKIGPDEGDLKSMPPQIHEEDLMMK